LKYCLERSGIQWGFSTIGDLVEASSPEVIHIVTPPHTHFELALQAIEAGCHVLVEKPMCLSLAEGERLFELAQEKGVKLCAMHNHYFDPCMLRCREMAESGRMGRIVGVESHYGLNTRIDAFRRYLAPGVLPWIYGLPGGAFHDFMPHPLYVMLPFLGEIEDVLVAEMSAGELPGGISDELRVLVKGINALGTLCLSFAEKPPHHFVRIYGTAMMAHVNFDTMTATFHPVSGLPKAAQKAVYNLSEAWQLGTGTLRNVRDFATGRLRPYQGMKTLIHRFYDAVKSGGEPPVSRDEALSVLAVMDRIWPQVKNIRLSFETPVPAQKGPGPRVLVTGASGFLGTRLVEMLCERDFKVRALVRRLSNIERLKSLPVEIAYGDVGRLGDLEPAFEGVDLVVHAAADTAGREEEGETSTIQGTRNVIGLCRSHGIKRLVYISTLNVYGTAGYEAGRVVDEDAPLERNPELRGAYTLAKLEAEGLVLEAMKEGGVPIVCLRPGTIFGPGGETFTRMMGFSLAGRVFAVIGPGDFVLPLVFIDNLCDAIITSLKSDRGDNGVFNLVDPDRLTKREYMEKLVRKLNPGARVVTIPYPVLDGIVRFQELMMRALERKPFLTAYRLKSSQNRIVFDSSKFMRTYGWKPPFTLEEGLQAVLEHAQAPAWPAARTIARDGQAIAAAPGRLASGRG
ncbi:MAG: NAD-dependent epimerase/dehydratase family protein, partial [Desulfomonilia bacterium]